VHHSKLSWKGYANDSKAPSFWPKKDQQNKTQEEITATINDDEARRNKIKAETNVIAKMEGKIRLDTESCYNYETKLPANGLFNYKKDNNVVEKILKQKKDQN